MTQPTLSVLVPCYNEILTIEKVLERVSAVPIDKEIIVVDDGSTDGTRTVLGRIIQRWSHAADPVPSALRVFMQPRNMGKGAAIRRAIGEARGKVSIVQDADLEYDPMEYPKLVDPIVAGTADVVYGSRFAGHPRRVLYFWHSLGNRVLTTLSNMLTDLDLTDMETCYKAFRTPILQSLPLRENRFGFEPEVTGLIAQLDLRIYEIAISYAARSYSEGKKIGWRDGLEALKVMWRASRDRSVQKTGLGRQAIEIMRRSGRYNDWLFRQIEPYLGQRVLEVGSGIGNLTKKLLARERIVATDLGGERVGALAARFGHLDHVRVEALDPQRPLPAGLQNEKLDTVLCCNLLQCLEDDRAALATMRSALASGGRLVLVAAAHPVAYGALDRELGQLRRYEQGDLEAKVREAGFEIEQSFHLNAISLVGWMVQSRLLQRNLIPRGEIGFVESVIPFLDVERRLGLSVGLSLVIVARAAPIAAERGVVAAPRRNADLN